MASTNFNCPDCGAALPANAQCTNCGNKVTDIPLTPAPGRE